MCTLKPFTFSSSSKLTILIISRSTVDSAVYSALVVLGAIKYCSLIAHILGQPAYIIMYPIRKWFDNESSDYRCCFDMDQCASMYHSNHFYLSGLKVTPYAFFFNKYLHIRL